MNRILIIEDDTDINNMMAEALQKSGYECTQAFSGTEGLLYIERDAFSLAVLDLMLPGDERGEAASPDQGKAEYPGHRRVGEGQH